MKKSILLLVVVGCLGIAEAQTITKISGQYLGISYPDLDGVTIYHQAGAVNNMHLVLTVEFTNGPNDLEEGDSVIIAGDFTQNKFQEDYGNIIIDTAYLGNLFIVRTGGIAAGATKSFEIGDMPVSGNGVSPVNPPNEWRANVEAYCIYTSADGNLYRSGLPKKTVSLFLVNNTAVLESAMAAVKVFPTLASDEIQLTNLKNTDVAVYSLVGQQMLTYSNLTGNASIDVSSLANGIYFVKMQNGSVVRTEKIKIVR